MFENVWDDDYPIGMPDQTVVKLTELSEEHWGVTSGVVELPAPTASNDQRFCEWFLRYQRLRTPRGEAATMYRWVTDLDERPVLGSTRVTSVP